MLPATEVVYDAWYMAVPGRRLKRGQTIGKQLLGQSVLIGRSADGSVFALRDICPQPRHPPQPRPLRRQRDRMLLPRLAL